MNRSLTYASAESITGGRIQSYFTEQSGSSSYFVGGMTAYATSIKESLLNVNGEIARKHNAVCEQTANEMALGCFKCFGADISIATTGYVEKFEFDGKVFTPKMHVSVYNSVAGIIVHKMFELPENNSRAVNLEIATKYAIDFMLEAVGD